tara:strand:- start:160 stop:939 length:780 start_codon:yes stop_codon:yes gene_type:complete
MLTDKGVPLTIFKQLADINQRYYKRMDEGLVKKAEGGSIMDSLLAMFNPISKVNVGEEEAFKALQEAGKLQPPRIAPLPLEKPELEDEVDSKVTAPLPPKKPELVDKENKVKDKEDRWQDNKTIQKIIADEPIIGKIIQVESSGNPNAINKKTGAKGLMQIMKNTAEKETGYGVNYNLSYNELSDPVKNVKYGADYFKGLKKSFGSDRDALIAYNWGPGNYRNFLKNGYWTERKNGKTIKHTKLPPETRNYIKKILGSN